MTMAEMAMVVAASRNCNVWDRDQQMKPVSCLTSHHLSLPGKGGGKMPSPYDFMCLGRSCEGIVADISDEPLPLLVEDE